MRKEYVTYNSDLPIQITYATIKEYPLHWHNTIEIVYVLKGKINISIDTDNFELYENELEIINIDESHRLYSDEDNKILLFHIDQSFFEKYYKDIKNIYFYTNTSDLGAQEGEEYIIFRTLLAKLLCESVQKVENYDEEIESILIDLLFHLINNFHYLIYDQEELKDNKEQLERYHRISKYIFNNYNNNITLQAIAKKEFLSPHYLSHEIKNVTGYSFTDLINLTRVEESVKLLLDTDMSIYEISEEVGFSHTRYFNKHFKSYYNCTPLQFRRKNKFDEATLEKMKDITLLPLEDSIDILSTYLENYERFNYENKLWTIDVDINNNIEKYSDKFREIISLGDIFDLMIEDNKDILESLQNEIHFEYGRIEYFFHNNMGIFKSSDFINWNRVKTVLEFMASIELKPLIVIDNYDFEIEDYIHTIESFYSYFSEIEYYYLSDVKFQLNSTLSLEIKKELRKYFNNSKFNLLEEEFIPFKELNPIYDTAYMLPYIIHSSIFTHKDLSFLRAFDVIEKEIYLNNEVFIGASGIINDMDIRKPSYYAYYLLSKLSGNVVAKEDGYIVTKDRDTYSILLYTYNENIDDLFKNSSKLKSSERKISLNLFNVPSDSRITFYEINQKVGSSYDYWVSMGKPERLNKEEMEILSKASFPKIEFKYAKKSPVLNIITKLKGYGATLILIKPTKK